jgi:hypothetical protein
LAQQVLLSNFMYAYLNLINHGYQQEQQALYEQQIRSKNDDMEHHQQGSAVSEGDQFGYQPDGGPGPDPAYDYGYDYDYGGTGYGGYEAYDEYGVYDQYEEGYAEEGVDTAPAKSPESSSSSSSSSAGGDDYWTGEDDQGPAHEASPPAVDGLSKGGSGHHIGHRRNFQDSSVYVRAAPVTQL